MTNQPEIECPTYDELMQEIDDNVTEEQALKEVEDNANLMKRYIIEHGNNLIFECTACNGCYPIKYLNKHMSTKKHNIKTIKKVYQ